MLSKQHTGLASGEKGYQPFKGVLKQTAMVMTVASVAVMMGACSDNDDSETVSMSTAVNATLGGIAASSDNAFAVVFPAGALEADTNVIITKTTAASPGGTMASAGNAYKLDFEPDVALSSPARLEFSISSTPQHPQLGESVVMGEDGWERSGANFFRSSDNTVVSFASDEGTFMPVLRTLQAESGDGVERGKTVFMEESFGNEAFFGDVLGLHTLLNGLTPAQAVGVGVQIDITKVPQGIVDVLTGTDYAAKQAALQNPAITQALLKAGAVIGVKSTFADEQSTTLTSAGITCALCHVSVEPTEFELSQGALTPLPIGVPDLGGLPNLAMDAGAILSLTPFAQNAGQATADTLASYGPGQFDVRALPDNPLEDNVNNPTSYPALWNFVDLSEQGYAFNWDGLFKSSGDSELALASQGEAVYDLVMHANGAFGTASGSVSPQLAVAPSQALLDALVAAEDNAQGNVITQQSLLDLQSFQRSLISPEPAAYDVALAEQGFYLFNDKAQCAGCHRTAEFTGPVVSANIVLEAPEGGLAGGIKTPGLRGIASTAPYFHDGSADSLMDVMNTYSGRIVNELTDSEKLAVVEYMKSL